MKLIVDNDKPIKTKRTKVKQYPQCPSCGSQTTIKIKTCDSAENACIFCFIQGRIVTCK
jgi:transcription elongation factor Elf1